MKGWGTQAEWLCNGLINMGLSEKTLADYLKKNIATSLEMISIDDYLKLWAWSERTLKDNQIGVKIGANISIGDLGLIAYIGHNSATLGDFLYMVARYQSIFMTGMSFSYRTNNEKCEIRYQINHTYNEAVRQDVEAAIGVAVAVLKMELQDKEFPFRVNFAHPMSGSLNEYTELLGEDVHFNQPNNSVVVGVDMLTHPLSDSDPNLLKILQEQADKLLTEIECNDDFVSQVRYLITSCIGDETYSLDMLCDHLSITTRTLHRRLKKYGMTYQSLKEEIIVNLAKESLIKTTSSVTEIALRLGYAESSSFVRAFKRLSGISPLQYRNQQSAT